MRLFWFRFTRGGDKELPNRRRNGLMRSLVTRAQFTAEWDMKKAARMLAEHRVPFDVSRRVLFGVRHRRDIHSKM